MDDLVLVKKQKVGEGSKKLIADYRIAKQLPNDRYVIAELKGSKRVAGKGYENVEAVDNIKPWQRKDGISSPESSEGEELD